MSKKSETPTLFTLTNSKIFLEFVSVINQVQDSGERLSYNEIWKRLRNVYRSENSSQEHDLFPETLNYYFGITKEMMSTNGWRDELLDLPIAANIPIRATKFELYWLKIMLQDPASDFLLHEDLREKLLRNLDKYFHIIGVDKSDIFDYKDFWSPNYLRPEATLTQEFRKKLRTIWHAIISCRKIRYINHTPHGIWKGVEAPCRLEFDCAYGTYNLIIWPNKERRPVKMRVDRLEIVEMTDEIFDENIINEAFSKSLTEKKEVAHLQLLDKIETNALLRFYTRFEGYDKDSHQDDKNKNLYHIDLYYYHFDTNDVLHGLMSLGPYVRVLSPQTLHDNIAKNYKKAANRIRIYSPM